MDKSKKFTAKAKLEGQFRPGTTRCQFSINICEAQAVSMAHPFVESFRTVMAELYPVASMRPDLRKITITINLP